MKRFTIAVTVTAMLLTMISPVQTGDADGWLSLIQQRNQVAINARNTTRKAQQVAKTMAPQVQTVSYSRPVQQTCVNGVCIQYPTFTTWSHPAPQYPAWNQPQYSSWSPPVVEPKPQVREIVRYVERPQPRVKEIVRYVERPRETSVVDLSDDVPMYEVDRGDKFHRGLRRAIRIARRQGELTRQEADDLMAGCSARNFRERYIKPAVLAKMRASDALTDEELDENGHIVETAIDWERMIPLFISALRDILELLIEFGIIDPASTQVGLLITPGGCYVYV